jgi:hypothetical protein
VKWAPSKTAPVENGYGRVDAFGVARNLLFGGDPRNLRPQNAPVSFPHMWGLKNTAWLQWGANINSVMERNIGQTLGVGARFDANFVTTSRLDNLNVLEKRVYKLTPPEWREDVLGPVDRALADRGKPLYGKLCSNCHERPFAVSPTGLATYQLFRLNEVGTSPVVATNFDRTVITPKGERRLADASFEAIEAIKQQYYKTHNISPEVQADWEGRDMRPMPAAFRSTLADADKYPDSKGGRVYPAKPLAGIWATAPYLNNGISCQHVGHADTTREPPEDVHVGQPRVRHEVTWLPIDAGCAVSRTAVRLRYDQGRQFERGSRLRHAAQ